jgi:excisionase family DNA binding protein
MAESEILTLQEVCELTKLSKNTIYCLRYAGKIPHFKFGPRLLRFKRSEILYWMEHRNEEKEMLSIQA